MASQIPRSANEQLLFKKMDSEQLKTFIKTALDDLDTKCTSPDSPDPADLELKEALEIYRLSAMIRKAMTGPIETHKVRPDWLHAASNAHLACTWTPVYEEAHRIVFDKEGNLRTVDDDKPATASESKDESSGASSAPTASGSTLDA